MFAVPWCAPVCAHPSPSNAEPGECWWPGAGGGSNGCSCPQRDRQDILCPEPGYFVPRIPSPQPDHRQPLLNLPQVLPCLYKPSRAWWGGSQGP